MEIIKLFTDLVNDHIMPNIIDITPKIFDNRLIKKEGQWWCGEPNSLLNIMSNNNGSGRLCISGKELVGLNGTYQLFNDPSLAKLTVRPNGKNFVTVENERHRKAQLGHKDWLFIHPKKGRFISIVRGDYSDRPNPYLDFIIASKLERSKAEFTVRHRIPLDYNQVAICFDSEAEAPVSILYGAKVEYVEGKEWIIILESRKRKKPIQKVVVRPRTTKAAKEAFFQAFTDNGYVRKPSGAFGSSPA